MNDIFTEKFKEALEQTTLSQTSLAQKVGISKQCISDFKSGKSYPSIQTLRALCVHLDITADELLGLDEKKVKEEIKKQNVTTIYVQNSPVTINQ